MYIQLIAIKKTRKMKTQNFLIVLFISMIGYSQTPILPLDVDPDQITNGAYLKDTENQLLPFIGTWVYQQGNKKVTLKFHKILYYGEWGFPRYYLDMLEANYKVEEGSTVIYNNLNDSFDGTAQISGSFFKDGKYLISYIDEPKCDIGGDGKIWIDSTGKMHWDVELTYAQINDFVDCPQSSNTGFFDTMTLPFDMVLTKVP